MANQSRKTGVILAVILIGGGVFIYKAMPFLISLTLNVLYLGTMLFVFLAVIYFVIKIIRR